jgi:hypothetical protein
MTISDNDDHDSEMILKISDHCPADRDDEMKLRNTKSRESKWIIENENETETNYDMAIEIIETKKICWLTMKITLQPADKNDQKMMGREQKK